MHKQDKNNWLIEYAKNVTSQHGEDGIIEKIFEIAGTTNKWCVELGALNGTHDSNTWSLIKQKEWKGVLIEADQTYFEKLKEVYGGNKNTFCINTFVSFDGEQLLDLILSQTPIPEVFDFFSLDIDGNDYHIWDSLNDYRPRVVVIEFNPSIPNDVYFVQPKDMSVYQGSSLNSITALAKRKGYELIAVTESNAFYAVSEFFDLFGISDNSLDAMRLDHKFETKLFQLYDGTLMISGNDMLIWHNKKIDTEAIQALPCSMRFYPAKISSNKLIRYLKYLFRKSPFYKLTQKIIKIVK